MGEKERGSLTEPMYYTLMAFLKQEKCGTEVSDFIDRKTKGRVRLGPGTLYSMLAKFADQGILQETQVEGRKRTYRITEKGLSIYRDELERLRACVRDGEEEEQ